MKKVRGGKREKHPANNKHNHHKNKSTQQNLPTTPITVATTITIKTSQHTKSIRYTHYINKGTRDRHTCDTTSSTNNTYTPIDNAVKNQAHAIQGQNEWYTDTTGTPRDHGTEAEGDGERAALKQTARQ